jgi:hypothetical protein
MANHSGSYMLNEVFRRLHQTGFVDFLGKQRSQEFVLDIVNWACRKYDCHEGEILAELGATFGVCAYCLQPAQKIIDDWCLICRAELLMPDELTPAERRALKKAQASKTSTERQ